MKEILKRCSKMFSLNYMLIGGLILAAFVILYNAFTAKPVPVHRQDKYRRRSRRYDRETMADTSSYSVEERLLASVWPHKRPHTGKSMKYMQWDFSARFHKEAALKMAILWWEKKLFRTGSVLDKERMTINTTGNVQ